MVASNKDTLNNNVYESVAYYFVYCMLSICSRLLPVIRLINRSHVVILKLCVEFSLHVLMTVMWVVLLLSY